MAAIKFSWYLVKRQLVIEFFQNLCSTFDLVVHHCVLGKIFNDVYPLWAKQSARRGALIDERHA